MLIYIRIFRSQEEGGKSLGFRSKKFGKKGDRSTFHSLPLEASFSFSFLAISVPLWGANIAKLALGSPALTEDQLNCIASSAARSNYRTRIWGIQQFPFFSRSHTYRTRNRAPRMFFAISGELNSLGLSPYFY